MRRDPLSLVEPAATAPVTQAAAFVHALKPSLGVLRIPPGSRVPPLPSSPPAVRAPLALYRKSAAQITSCARESASNHLPRAALPQSGQEEEAKAAHLGVRWRPTESSR